ncbi:magnesium-dependent phosphatase 1-like isoform X2 [Anthonomus grandis grandis]|uniref:magnesium-dependent phosphatase 1-like isoform X1 n=1 Tax=Anthonomus grandis grandis TaxID=2921223 RepID=UPI0021664240|nr:magnesium-dependent phosphatase 1-like isoform X1 [Anthonomus grandis grandis]XP_050312107.1 magnesium-dependent phosphatase 1-like isoform X2 [Anthonomus grandis grandis]
MKVDNLKVIVFDLDYTLWPFWVDTHVTPPFRRKNGDVLDAHGSKVKFYPEVPGVLKSLKEEGYELGVASRTGEIKGANQLLDLFGWDKYFTYKEIFPGSKVTHFNNIKKQSKYQFENMLFFDDESRNIYDLERLGVVSVLVKHGVTQQVVDEGIQKFIKKGL